MPTYRKHLPQLTSNLMLTDGGLETTMIFDHGFDLPEFAAFVLLETDAGLDALRTYFRAYLDLARDHRLGFVLESPTWRASRSWGAKLGYLPVALVDINRRAISLMTELRAEYERLRKQRRYGLAKIYEMVINTDPCYAYLLSDNTVTDHKTVMAHVYAHCDFFRNNIAFAHTNRRMVDQMANHATRIRRHVDKQGFTKVERFIDICLSL